VLFKLLGLSFLSGIGVFLVAFGVNAGLGYCGQIYTKRMMKIKDKRMTATTQAISNVKQLKFYGWTDSFQEEISQRREQELVMFRKLNLIAVFVIASLYFFPQVLSSVVFSTYIGTGHYIDLSKAFTVLIFFELIKNPLRSLPMFVSFFVQFLVSMRRL